MKTCKKCSASGIYVDYAGPDVIGGRAVACKKCKGRGWINDDDTPLEDADENLPENENGHIYHKDGSYTYGGITYTKPNVTIYSLFTYNLDFCYHTG